MSVWFLDNELSTCFIRNGIMCVVLKLMLLAMCRKEKVCCMLLIFNQLFKILLGAVWTSHLDQPVPHNLFCIPRPLVKIQIRLFVLFYPLPWSSNLAMYAYYAPFNQNFINLRTLIIIMSWVSKIMPGSQLITIISWLVLLSKLHSYMYTCSQLITNKATYIHTYM